MRKLFSILFILFLVVLNAPAQNSPETYRLYDAKGKAISYEKMINELAKEDVVFFGEMHNCPITHWLEYKVLESLYQAHKGNLDVGMEMFETDNQLIIDEYLKGMNKASQFEDECRLWPNYSTDYKPIVDFVDEHHLRLIATNVPRRYANIVKYHGLAYLDSLSAEAKTYMPKLPIPYKTNEQADQAFSLMAMMGKTKNTNPKFLGQSQGLKDATMAWFIAKNMKRPFIHFNGNYHTDANDGIIRYLNIYRPKTKFKTIYSVKQENINRLDSTYLGHGDYYICIPEDMVTTY